MNLPQVSIKGTLKPDGSLELDERPDLPPGRVRVVVTPEGALAPPEGNTWSLLERIWRERQGLGKSSRTRDEIDADIAALRGELDEGMLRIERSREATPE